MTEPLRIDGADISHWQSGSLNWASAKRAGLKFVYHKATESTTYKDARYSDRRAEAKKAGVPFGAYHFARPTKSSAKAEALWFINYAQPAKGDLRPALDLEVNKDGLSQSDLTKWVADFVAVVKSKTGVVPVIYTPFNLNETFGALLWQPRYNNDNVPPRTAKPWKQVDIWQFSNGVYGVPNDLAGFGHVDLNRLRDGLTVNDLLIPTEEKQAPPVATPQSKTTAQKVIDIAISQVGVHEGRSNGSWNNDTRYADEVPGLKWADKQPWCQTFVTWVARKAGVQHLYGDPERPTASCDFAGDWWKKQGRWSEYPAVGAQVFFGYPHDLNHTGIVYAYDADFIYTIEGNTNDNGSREGDGVYRKKRPRRGANIIGYGYPKFPEGIQSADPKYGTKAPATPTPSPAPAGKVKTYIVKRGDTLSKIAARFKVTWQQIAKWSKIKNPNKIEVGQKVIVSDPNAKEPSPAAPAPKKKTFLKFAHVSLQFSDTKAEQTKDLETVFARGYDVLTGTEAGHSKTDWNQRELDRVALKYGYRISNPIYHDTWVAVKSVLVVSDWKQGSIHALEQSSKFVPKPPGRWGPKGVTWASWNMGKTYGQFAVAAVHPLTWGGTGTVALKNETDKKYAGVVRDWHAALPKATEAFVGGDFNRNDKKYDVFMGIAPFITSSDELKRWETTGHGPIDGIAREKTSTRVKALSVTVLDDTELALGTDHFVVETVWEITAL